MFTGASGGQQLGTQFFNGIRAGNVIASGRTVNVTWTVDMRDARTFAAPRVQPGHGPGHDLVPGPDLDHHAGPRARRGQQRREHRPRLHPHGPDGDGVYTGSLPVTGPTYNGIGYRVAFGNTTDGYVLEGSGGFDAGRRRYRYITDVNATAFSFGRDRFRPTTSGNPLPWEINPTGPVRRRRSAVLDAERLPGPDDGQRGRPRPRRRAPALGAHAEPDDGHRPHDGPHGRGRGSHGPRLRRHGPHGARRSSRARARRASSSSRWTRRASRPAFTSSAPRRARPSRRAA